MENKDNLPNIISFIALVIFLIFAFTLTRSSSEDPLQGGDIQKAMATEQYR
jgi:hypothetical protein